ncbi:T9SS type A sorting domain-containing protein [bacterium]|nr:T9SS type A sorting domain-containing protein [bacterium]
MKNVIASLTIVLLATSVVSADTIIPGGSVSGLWSAAGSPYIVTGDITIPASDTLSIGPGVEIRFDQDVGLSVSNYASLIADGAGDSIVFTANTYFPVPGYWDGISIGGDAIGDMAYCVFTYGDAINDMWGGSTTLTDCRISMPYTGYPGPLTFIRCEITVSDVSLIEANPWLIDECIFRGDLHAMDVCHSVTINNTTIWGNLAYSSWSGTIQVTGSEIFGSADMGSEEGHFYLTNSTVHGLMHGLGVLTIDGSTLNGPVDYEDPNNEGIRLSTTSSTFNGVMTIGWTFLDMFECQINDTLKWLSTRNPDISYCTLSAGIKGYVSPMNAEFYIEINLFDGCGIDLWSNIAEGTATIRGNLIVNSPAEALKMDDYGGPDYTDGLILESNTIYGAGSHGIAAALLAPGDYGAHVRNNIVANCAGYGISVTGYDTTDVCYNDAWNNTLGDYFGFTPGAGSISEDPLFVDPENGDYHLQSIVGSYHGGAWLPDPEYSPCIDAGDPTSPFSLEPEPNGGRVNMGTYGNTEEASKSFVPDYPDMYVDLTYVSGSPVSPGGGNLFYELFAENQDSIPLNFDGWIDIQYESYTPFTVIQRGFQSYQPGWTINRPDMYYPVEPGYPAGNYTMTAKMGDFPDTVWVADGFPFTKDGDFFDSEFIPFMPDAEFPDPFTEIDKGSAEIEKPSEFALTGANPNPFNPTTSISIQLSAVSRVNLTVYDISGRKVATLVDGFRDAGYHQITFDGSGLASGVYLVKLEAGDYSSIQKVMLLK